MCGSWWLMADKEYDAEHIRQYCDRYRIWPVIQLHAKSRKFRFGSPRLFDRPKDRRRNVIERMFSWREEIAGSALAMTSRPRALQSMMEKMLSTIISAI